MEVKKIVEGMTAPQVAQVIDDNFKAQNKILEEDIVKQNNVIGVSEYKDFSEAEAVNVGDVRKYNGFLYECVEATTGAFDASKWKKSSFKAETEKKLSELGLELGSEINRSSGKSIKSDIWCSFGALNEKGVIEDSKKRLYIVLDKIKAISLSVNNDNVDRLQFCVFGNNEGLGYPVVKIRDFSNDDFTNNTEYQYLFVMVKNEDDSDFVESKLLHLICSDAIISASIPFSKIAKTPQYNDTRPIDSNSLFNINKSFFGVVSSFEDITNQVQFNEGHYINLKGDLVSNVSFSCSEMISTDGVSYVRLQSIVPNIGIAVLFFDEKGEKLLNESIVGRTISLEYHTYDFLIPSKATHFMVCGLTRDNYEIFIYKPNLISVQENLAYQDITELLDFTPNGFYEPDGDWASSTNWTTSKIYPTTNIKTIHASVCVNNALFAICYFDESKNLLLSESLIKQSEGLFEGLITSNIPYNAKYFAISSYIKNGYEPKVVVSTLSCIGNNNIFDWVDAKYTQEIDRAYLNNNGIETQIDASFFVSNYIDCSDINAVRYQGLSGTTICQCIWYDENKNIIYPCKTVLTDIPNKIRQILYGKPNRAKYCRLSCKYDIFHKFEFSINRTISDVLNKSIVSNPNKNFNKVTLLIIYGQSLSIGADSNAISTKPKFNSFMFDGGIVSRNTVENIKNIIPAIEVDVESPARGMAEMIVESFGLEDAYNVNMGTWDDKKFIVNCPGVGGAEIEALLGESYYQYVRNAIQGAKNICDKNGWELDIPLWCWVQGEQNIKNKTTTNTYKELLTQLHNKFCQDVYDITGISTRPKCVLYQPNNQNLFSLDFGYGNEYMGVPTAFVELLMDSDDFIASTPTYIFDHADKNGYWVHLNAESYKLLGAYLGYSIKKYMSDNVVNKGVIPLNVNIEGNNVSIKYNVPCPPLSIDTNYVNKIKNYGFSIIDSNNIELIEDVIVFNDTVTLKCSSSPKGAKLRYGLNGDSHKGGSDNPYLSIAGRMYGARGNLRDNQGSYIYKDINGRKLPLYNWAYTFEKLL